MTADLRPPALRAILVLIVTAAHAAAVGGLVQRAEDEDAVPGFRQIGIAARGEVAFEATAMPVPERLEPAPPSDTPPSPAQPASAASAPSMPPVVEPLPVLPAGTAELPPPEPPSEVVPEASVGSAAAASAEPVPAAPPAGASAQALGVETARTDVSPAAELRYAALVSAAVNRHKHFPGEAQRRGARGVVELSFTVGRSGRIESHAVTRSSGSDVLDAAAVRMLHAAQLPPPPAGAFRGQIAIRFQIRQ